MIFVDRNRVAVSEAWSKRSAAAFAKAEKFFSRPRDLRLQERFDFDADVWRSVKPELVRLFQGKCAYCESLITSDSEGEVDHFRPKIEALGLIAPSRSKTTPASVKSDPDAYWWLAYEWSNLYFACLNCARSNKRNSFPVLGRKRAAPGTRGDALRRELALLIDPCVDRRPEHYLVFDDSGRANSRKPPDSLEATRFRQVDRGLTTIEVFGLNRPDLVEARHVELRRLRDQWVAVAGRGSAIVAIDVETIRRLFDAALPYAGMRRQFLIEWSGTLQAELSSSDRSSFKATVKTAAPDVVLPSHREEGIAATPAARKRTRVRPMPPPTKGGDIESIHIKDFRAVHDLTLRFSQGTPERAGWIVLLGENGAGKSSVLQAVALALMGEKYLRQYMREFKLRPTDFLRRIHDEQTVDFASVSVQFRTGGTVELTVTKKEVRFSERPPAKLFVRAYGSTRLLPRRNARRPPFHTGVKKSVTNLFDPARPVFNANDWLARVKGTRFGSAALSLKDLLNLPSFALLSVDSGKVLVPMHGLLHGLDDLSAGYESVLTMAADVMAGVLGTVHDLRLAPGVVLLDEIDAHLHPRWKMRIVESLRATFSSMQFIVTTHEPLCLRGVREHEVVLLRRDGDDVSYVSDLPSPSDLRVDQLLTSDLFGLHTALDPEVDAKFDTYYRLLARGEDQLNRRERETLIRLRGELPPVSIVRMLGDTKREQLIYEAVDEYLAKTLVHKNPAEAAELRDDLRTMRADVKRRIADIWSTPAVAE